MNSSNGLVIDKELYEKEGFDSVEEYLDNIMPDDKANAFWARMSDDVFAAHLRLEYGAVPPEEVGIFRKNIIGMRIAGLAKMGMEINPIFLSGDIPDKGCFNRVGECPTPTGFVSEDKYKVGDRYMIPIENYKTDNDVQSIVYDRLKSGFVLRIEEINGSDNLVLELDISI